MTLYNAAMEKVLNKFPARMRALPITEDGWPQLFFAGITKEGKPNLRCADTMKRVLCVKKSLCWLCGQKLGAYKAFCIGPMCAITRTTSEPPCHRECAEFAAIACPFLTKPRMKRNDTDLPEGSCPAPGIMIARNPGVVALWITHAFKTFKTGGNITDWLIRVGNPTEVLWYAEGKPATKEQVLDSIESGFPRLKQEAELDGTEAISQLVMQRRSIDAYMPRTT